MNNLELKSIRQGLGLTVLEVSELPQVNVTKRSFQRWEAGDVPVPKDIESIMSLMASHYSLVLNKMLADVESATIRPAEDEIKGTVKPVLPYFQSFELFQMETGCPHVAYWKIYQSVISHLILIGKITKLDDAVKIPENWGIWKWLKGTYEHVH